MRRPKYILACCFSPATTSDVALIKHPCRRSAEKRKAGEGAGAAGDDEDAEEESRLMLEAAEFDRAKERLTLKHRNTSRWARRPTPCLN